MIFAYVIILRSTTLGPAQFPTAIAAVREGRPGPCVWLDAQVHPRRATTSPARSEQQTNSPNSPELVDDPADSAHLAVLRLYTATATPTSQSLT